MGGTYVCDDLRRAGLDAGKASGEARLFPEELFIAPKGHPRFNVRSLLPLDEGWLSVLMDENNPIPVVTARRNGLKEIEVNDGTITTMHMREVNRRLVKAGRKTRRMLVRFIECDDKQFMLLRMGLNGKRTADGPSSLASMFKQAEAEGATHDEIAATRADLTTRLVADLLRFPSLTAAVREAFDAGRLPLALVSSFVNVPREEQGAVLAGTLAKIGGGNVSLGKAKRAIKEATGGKAGERKPRMLPRGKLERIRDVCAEDVTRSGDDASFAAFAADFCRLVMGEADALDEWEEVREAAPLVGLIRAALAPAPARKTGKGAK